LQWDETKVRFSGDETEFPEWLILNPFNFKSDASYCTSRFFSTDNVPYPSFPVEITFGTRLQLMLFFAQGYQTEVDPRDNEQGAIVFWSAQDVDSLLQNFTAPSNSMSARESFELLWEAVEVIEILVKSGNPRYVNLTPSWPRLRKEILEKASRLPRTRVVELIGRLLWDEPEGTISNLFHDIATWSDNRLSQIVNKRVFVNYRVAKLILNMETFGSSQGSDARAKKIATEITKIRWQTSGSAVLIGDDGEELCHNRSDFVFFQSWVVELAFPLRAAFLQTNSPALAATLATSQIFDFPGVAREENNQNRITRRDLRGPHKLRELCRLIKRGKTGALVASTMRAPRVDALVVMLRIGDFPQNTGQLLLGVQFWLAGLRQKFPPPSGFVGLNLAFTFCGPFLKSVGSFSDGGPLHTAFTKAKNLGSWADPKVCRHFLTTYKEQDEGRIDGSLDAVRVKAILLQNEDFISVFGNNTQTLDALLADGGLNLLLADIQVQVQASPRTNILLETKQGLCAELHSLVASAVPTGTVDELKDADIDAWLSGICSVMRQTRTLRPTQDAAAFVCSRLKEILGVSPDGLEILPVKLRDKDADEFIATQFARWRSCCKGRISEPQAIGFTDIDHANRTLGYLTQFATYSLPLASWLVDNFGNLSSVEDRKRARRILALKMGDALAFPGRYKAHHRCFTNGIGEGISERLEAFSSSEKKSPRARSDEESPHYQGFLAPFMAHLGFVKAAQTGPRPPQPGDPEILRLATDRHV
jgi:hypothetical protein